MVNQEVTAWLQASGLSQYESSLLSAGYDDLEVLASLEEADLDAIGVTAPGHRKKMLMHSRRLAEGTTVPHLNVTATAAAPSRPAPVKSAVSTGRMTGTGTQRLGKTLAPPMRADVTGNDCAQTLRNAKVNLDEIEDDPDEVTLLVERVAVESHNRRVRVKDFFSPYDQLKSGYVSVDQFRRGIAATGLDLTPAEVELLIEAFSVRKTNFGGPQFDYVSFSQPFGERDLEKDPRRTARNPRSQLLHIDVVRGIAPPPRFIGTLDPEAPPVDPVPGNTTQRWSGAKDPGAKKPKPTRNPHSKEHSTVAAASAPIDKLNPEEKQRFVGIMSRLRAIVRQRGIVVKTLFRDFDRSRNGFVTRSQFRQSLPPLFELTEEEAQLVMRKYTKTKFAEVDYMSFHEALESDEIPLHAPDIASPYEPVTVGTRDISKCELPDEMKDIAPRDAATRQLLSRLNADIFNSGLRIRDHLRPLDSFLTGHLLPTKFQQGLVSAGISLTELDLLLLILLLKRASDGKVNYHRFCRQMEVRDTGIPAEGVPMITAAGKTSTLAHVKEPELPAGTDPSTGTLVTRQSRSGIAVAKILLRLQNQIAKNRVRVLEFFRDYDPLRKGFVTNAKFRSALTQMGLQLTAGEIRDLEERFAVDDSAANRKASEIKVRQGPGTQGPGASNESPAKKGGDISYVEFCEWLDTAFTRPNLEKTPTAPPPSWTTNEDDPIYMTEEEADELEVLMERLAGEVRVRGVVPKPVFADFDRTKIGTVSRNQFLQGLTFLSLRVSDREAELLFKRFRERHPDGREDVRYAEFAKVLLELGQFYDE